MLTKDELQLFAVQGLDAKIAELQAIRAEILNGHRPDVEVEEVDRPKKKRRMSRATRLAISKRMKARWALARSKEKR